MKHLLLFIALIAAIPCTNAQNVAINENGSSPDPSAILDISSQQKGVLIPRMMSLERTNIDNPANGLLVFDMSTNSFWYYSNGWQELSGNGGGMSGALQEAISAEFIRHLP